MRLIVDRARDGALGDADVEVHRPGLEQREQLARDRELERRLHGLAETQDGVVELAVDELARHLREAEEARAWAAAAADAGFAAEGRSIERETTPAERDSWRSW